MDWRRQRSPRVSECGIVLAEWSWRFQNFTLMRRTWTVC
jgi:hypothetical protein